MEELNDIRRVLRFLRDNPKSNIRQISEGAVVGKKEVSAMIKAELNLRKSKGNNGVTLYSLPHVPTKDENGMNIVSDFTPAWLAR